MDPAIRASPYEPGLYFVSPEPGTTLQSIGTSEWKVCCFQGAVEHFLLRDTARFLLHIFGAFLRAS